MPTKSTFVFSVGGDAYIAPWGAIPERSSKTDTAVPLATGRCGHRPLQNFNYCLLVMLSYEIHFSPQFFHKLWRFEGNSSTSGLEAFLLSTTSDFVCRERCRPAIDVYEPSRKTNKFLLQPPGPMWTSALWCKAFADDNAPTVGYDAVSLAAMAAPSRISPQSFHCLWIFSSFFAFQWRNTAPVFIFQEKSPQGIQTLWRIIQEQGRGC